MFAIFDNLLLNFLCIIMAVLLWRFLIDKKMEDKLYHRKALFISSTISIILCIWFPITLKSGFIYDLRHIPIWVAGLYGGPVISILVFFITLTYRFILGGTGIYIAIPVLLFQTLTSIYLSKHFLQWHSKKKIICGTVLTTGTSIMVLILTMFFFNLTILTIKEWFGYIAIYTLCMFIVLYIIESFLSSVLMHEKLIRMEKMEGLYHLAASVGHEIRQPITVCKGMVQLLSESNWSKEKQKEFFDIILAELNRAEDITKDYLTFAKPVSNKLETFDLASEITKTVNVIGSLANMNAVEIMLDISSAWVKGEKTKIQQCLINLSKNAIEAMEDGGTLNIRLFSNKKNAVIEISDTGIGMEPEQLKRLGEPFFSLKGSKGTGLGMMVVFRIIEGMNGKIDIQSELKKGTKVTIHLPLQEGTIYRGDDNIPKAL